MYHMARQYPYCSLIQRGKNVSYKTTLEYQKCAPRVRPGGDKWAHSKIKSSTFDRYTSVFWKECCSITQLWKLAVVNLHKLATLLYLGNFPITTMNRQGILRARAILFRMALETRTSSIQQNIILMNRKFFLIWMILNILN